MRTRTKISLAGLIAALLLASAVSTAFARRLEISNQGIRAVWESLIIKNGPTIVAECRITIEGTLHSRVIEKVRESLIGYITRAMASHPCATNEAWVLNGSERLEVETPGTTLPWHMRYDSFSGSLPAIQGVRLQFVGAGYLVRFLGLNCLYKSTSGRPMIAIAQIERGGAISTLRLEPASRILKLVGSVLCPEEVEFEGSATFTLLGNSNSVSMRLASS